MPHRIEHIETIPADLIGRFRALDVTASMQPTHCTLYTSADHSDNWSERLGTERADRAFRCRDLRDAGARLALGSDWPVAPFDPRGVIADAQLRRPHGQPDAAPVLPDQALTAAHGAARATPPTPPRPPVWQDVAGRIAVGLPGRPVRLRARPADRRAGRVRRSRRCRSPSSTGRSCTGPARTD